MKISIKAISFALLFFFSTSTTLAYNGDISIDNNSINFSTSNLTEGKTVRIYSSVTNNSGKDLLGTTRFFANDKQIGGDQAISIFAGKTDDIFIDWTPLSYGNYKIAVKIYPWESDIDNPNNNWVVKEIFVIRDTDFDGLPNETDPDDDNDGVIDEEDHFPLNSDEQYDTDGDGIGDNTDKDDDNDGIPDEFDDMPLDPNENMDTDKDGIGNISDTDDDNDGLSDTEEENIKTDPLKIDSDNDGVNDKEDKFPLNKEEWADTDGDGIGNNTDTDDDNDGLTDENDEYPLNKGPVIKIDNENFTIGLMENATFDASPSYDEDGKILSYLWEIDGNEFKEGNAINHTFTKKGDHQLKLTITDNNGETRSSEFQISVINISLYKQLALILITILLAMLIYFKYIAEAKNSDN